MQDQLRTTIKFVIHGVPTKFRNWWLVCEHGDLTLDGPKNQVNAFHRRFALSVFAPT